MTLEELKEKIENSEDRLAIISDVEELKKYNVSLKDLFNVINEYLSDEEKVKIFDYQHFANLSSDLRNYLISQFQSPKVKEQILYNENAVKDFGNNKIIDIVNDISIKAKQNLLMDEEFLKKYNITNLQIKNIVSSLDDETKFQVLSNRDLVCDKLKLLDSDIINFIIGLNNEEDRFNLLNSYSFSNNDKIKIIKTCSSKKRVDIVLEDASFELYEKMDVLCSLETSYLCDFFKNHKEFFEQSEIRPFIVIKKLESSKQIEFISYLEELDLTLSEKKEILVSLSDETKQEIELGNYPQEYKSLMQIKTHQFYRSVIVDLNSDLEQYRDLDNLIMIYPEELSKEEKSKFIKLCDICPNLCAVNHIYDDISDEFGSFGWEYKIAEEWIYSVIDNIDPNYSKAQKMALIDNAIGKKVSYSPDFDTEIFNKSDSRALWKIISSGYGICNGIAKVEKYMLNKVGIDSQVIGSGTHAFLKVKDMDFLLSNGDRVTGTTIVDPTWNLAINRFNGRPHNFCISYEKARKHDIDLLGNDTNCHKNDEKLQDATFNLDEDSLRQLYSSVGLADDDGIFLIKNLIDKSDKIHEKYQNNPEENIKQQFELIQETCPEFTSCQNSVINILSCVSLNSEKLNFDKCVINRVYNKNDKDKKPVLYVFIESEKLGQRFYFADCKTNQFVQLESEKFKSQFECYEMDLEKSNGIRPWEKNKNKKQEKDFKTISKDIANKEEAEEEER